MLVERNSSWIDDVKTKDEVESIDEILKRAFIKGVKDIENYAGHNMKNWEWGKSSLLNT